MPLTKEKIKHLEEKLEEEKKQLESELSRVGRKNPEVPGDWEAVPEDLNVETSDTGELSGAFEELENRAAIENTLEERFMLVSKALDNIKKKLTAFAPARKAKLTRLNPSDWKPIPPPQNASSTPAYKFKF